MTTHSSACDRFERELLLFLERDEIVGQNGSEREQAIEHLASCSVCRAEKEEYDQIKAAFRDLSKHGDAPGKAPAGWQDRVFASIDGGGARSRIPSGVWVLGAVAAAAVAVLVWRGRTPTEMPLAVRQEVVATGASRRSDADAVDSATVGDTMRAFAVGGPSGAVSGGRSHPREVRVYRNEREMVARCPDDTPRSPPAGQTCVAKDDMTELRFTLATPGRYRSLAIVGAAPAPKGTLDDDARAASASGAKVEMSPAIDVE